MPTSVTSTTPRQPWAPWRRRRRGPELGRQALDDAGAQRSDSGERLVVERDRDLDVGLAASAAGDARNLFDGTGRQPSGVPRADRAAPVERDTRPHERCRRRLGDSRRW
jgi:hypothetical protein